MTLLIIIQPAILNKVKIHLQIVIKFAHKKDPSSYG